MTISRRDFAMSTATASILAAIAPGIAGAKAFRPNPDSYQPELLPSVKEVWDSVVFVNERMGPTRLTGSKQHADFVSYLAAEFRASGLAVGLDTYTFPRWTATSWGLWAGARQLPVSSYYPHSNGFYSGTRDANGNYPNSGITQPVETARGPVVNLGAWTAPNSVAWAEAAGKIAYIDYTPPVFPLSTWYEVLDLWNAGRPDSFPPSGFGPINSILGPVDLNNAAKAGVLGVIVGWQGVSAGNAEGQYNPFPETLQGGGPALWVNSETAAHIKRHVAGTSSEVTLKLNARIEVVPSSTVYGILPGAHYGTASDEILINNTHSDGPNIVEENGGIGLVHLARYFSRVPRSKRPKTMVFMASTGHFSAGYLGSGRDFIKYHPEIVSKTVGVLTIEHLGCNEWLDVARGAELVYESTGKLVQGWAYGPVGEAAAIIEKEVKGSFNRLAILGFRPNAGGPFFGEGSGFNALGIPTIGYIPVPQYLCAITADGGISKMNPVNLHSQLEVFAKCLLTMQQTPAAVLKGA